MYRRKDACYDCSQPVDPSEKSRNSKSAVVLKPIENETRPATEVTHRPTDILEAAAVLFAERGYNGTSIRDLGNKVGLLGGSLYH